LIRQIIKLRKNQIEYHEDKDHSGKTFKTIEELYGFHLKILQLKLETLITTDEIISNNEIVLPIFKN
jgi:hypothetical protein